MKRPGWVTSVIVIQSIYALALSGLTIYLVVLARSPETLSEKDGAEAARGLYVAAGIFGAIAVLYILSLLGLWKAKLWGWWLGFLINVAAAIALLYSVVDDGWANSDATDILLPTAAIGLLILYWIPVVRSHYRLSGASERS